MANSYDFLAPPQPHHHVSRLIVLVVILAVILLLGWLYASLWSPTSDHVAVPENVVKQELTDADRVTIMTKSFSDPERMYTLNAAERAALMVPKVKSPAKITPTLTAEERNAIMTGGTQ